MEVRRLCEGFVCKVSRLGQLGWGWGKKQSGLDGGGGSVGRVCGANEGVSESRFKYSIN